MNDKEVSWEKLSEEDNDLVIEGVVDALDADCHVISSEEEFQELVRALNE
ncbi:hypothetical protein JDW15_10335 [Aerococcaceae bacterium zg-ZJ1578]|nr:MULTISPECIES: hypothetical protein [unclassified Facklamia]MBK0349002.1 hypothetical protein [Aerococcaceae bacterium zg-1578]MBR7926668.1 hypothetical protein [Aerococcaceae bacterium zg-ZUI334]MBS4461621.1 hypothetical protein [Aerococcaceae bacterium zg-B36]QQD65260.1 hypothetical protein JDW14_08175 [Aerococcaceae bacterium zg-252]NEW63913.1 hypothetical protein [Facklamia sp. 252]